jgi:hypothetical protein
MITVTTSQMPTFLSEILSGGDIPLAGDTIPAGQRGYFQERLKGRVYELIVSEFVNQCRLDSSVTQAAIGRRIDRRPEQINRWLSGPSNLTLETVSDLLLAICGGEPMVGVVRLREQTEVPAENDRQLSSAVPMGTPQNALMQQVLAEGSARQGVSEMADEFTPMQGQASSMGEVSMLPSAANNNTPFVEQPNALNAL